MKIRGLLYSFIGLLVSSMFAAKVQADIYCNNDGSICVYGTDNAARLGISTNEAELSQWINGKYLRYRVTFVTKDGKKLGKTIDYDITGYKAQYDYSEEQIGKRLEYPDNTTYYIDYKFSYDTFKTGIPNRIILDKFFSTNPTINYKDGSGEATVQKKWKSLISSSSNYGDTGMTFLAYLVHNAGAGTAITSEVNNHHNVFIAIEKIYTLELSRMYSLGKAGDVYGSKGQSSELDKLAKKYCAEQDGNNYTSCVYTVSQIPVYENQVYRNYVGTGTQIANLIKKYLQANCSKGNCKGKIPGTSIDTDYYFVAGDSYGSYATGLFGKRHYISNSDATEINKNSSLEIKGVDDQTTLANIENKKYGFSLTLVKYTPNTNTCNQNDANYSWNLKTEACCEKPKTEEGFSGTKDAGACCPVVKDKSNNIEKINGKIQYQKYDNGKCCDVQRDSKGDPKKDKNGNLIYKQYNPNTQKCEVPGSAETGKLPSESTTSYTVNCSPLNSCVNDTEKNIMSGTIQNVNFDSCTMKEGKKDVEIENGGMRFYSTYKNPLYKIDGYEDLYCRNSITFTHPFFDTQYTAGRIISIPYKTITMKNTVTCYSSDDTQIANYAKNGKLIGGYYYNYEKNSGLPELKLSIFQGDFNKEYTYKSTISTGKITLDEQFTSKVYKTTTYKGYFDVDFTFEATTVKTNVSMYDAKLYSNINSNLYKNLDNSKLNIEIPTGLTGTQNVKVTLTHQGEKSIIKRIPIKTSVPYNNQAIKTTGSKNFCELDFSPKKTDLATCVNAYNEAIIYAKKKDTEHSKDEDKEYYAKYSYTEEGNCELSVIYKSDTCLKINPGGTNLGKFTVSLASGTPKGGTKIQTTFVNNGLSSADLVCKSSFDVNEMPEIVYRPISLSIPFPGKDYTTTQRESGSNWTEEDIKTYITDRQDVYTKKPLYSITLTPQTIKEIREYNNANTYDDFNMDCKGQGEKCYSNFLNSNIVNSSKSVCYFEGTNRKAANFDECTKYENR